MAKHYRLDPRARLAMQLGDVVESAATVRAVHATLLDACRNRFPATFTYLRQLPSEDVIVADSACDDVSMLLNLAGIPVDPAHGQLTALAGARLVALGCTDRGASIAGEEWTRFFMAGGTLLSSDRSLLSLDIPSAGPVAASPRGPRRGRVWLAESVASRLPRIGVGCPLPAAAVPLEAGHVPFLTAAGRETEVSILAYDALSGQPLVVVIPVGRGWWIHSVIHWRQHAPIPATAVERRLVHPERHGVCGTRLPPDTTLGLLLAARAMVTILCVALEMTVARERINRL